MVAHRVRRIGASWSLIVRGTRVSSPYSDHVGAQPGSTQRGHRRGVCVPRRCDGSVADQGPTARADEGGAAHVGTAGLSLDVRMPTGATLTSVSVAATPRRPTTPTAEQHERMGRMDRQRQQPEQQQVGIHRPDHEPSQHQPAPQPRPDQQNEAGWHQPPDESRPDRQPAEEPPVSTMVERGSEGHR